MSNLKNQATNTFSFGQLRKS